MRPACLWRKGKKSSGSEAGSQFADGCSQGGLPPASKGGRRWVFLVAAMEAALQGPERPWLLPAGQAELDAGD